MQPDQQPTTAACVGCGTSIAKCCESPGLCCDVCDHGKPPATAAGPVVPDDGRERVAANTDPVSYRCSWCGRRLHREGPSGYWWVCRENGHPASHDPRRRGRRAWWAALMGLFA